MKFSRSIGNNIKTERVKKGMSQDELAEALFVTRQTVSNYETGRSNPGLETLQRIAEILGVQVSSLLYGEQLSEEKRLSGKKAVIAAAVFLCLFLTVIYLYPRLQIQHAIRYGSTAYLLLRLTGVPAVFFSFGWTLMQTADYFFGFKHIAIKKGVRYALYGLLGVCLLAVLPYLIWIASLATQSGFGKQSVSGVFPFIPVYTEASQFLVSVLYKFPYICTGLGIALWLTATKNRKNSK